MVDTIGLAMIVRADDKDAKLFKQCLESVSKHVDNLYITITGYKGQAPEIEEMCQKHKAKISYFDWVNDFALARNYNFSQVKDNWIFWVDADDVVERPEELKPTIKKMKEEGVDIGVMDYLYAFDEHGNCTVKHRKGRIVKNDGCVKWEGKLHEDLSEQRQVVAYFIPDIKIVHKSTDERFLEAKQRNLDIAMRALGEDKDPRNYWNVANAYLSLEKYREAIDYFLRFVDKSGSEIEKFTAYHRIASSYGSLMEYQNALKYAYKAVDLRPWFPDGYILLGEIYNHMRMYKHAKEMLVVGLSKEVPEDEYIVWNPRDYDFNPLRVLADVYFHLNKPQEAKICLENCLKIYPYHKDIKDKIKILEDEIKKLSRVDEIIEQIKGKNKKEIKQILEKTPQELKSHPKLVSIKNQHFVKTESSGKDLCIFCFFTDEEFNPDIVMKEGRGGSEEAVVHMSNRLADKGWNVEVFANCGHMEKKYGKVTWKPFWSYNYRDKYDRFIAWRHPTAFNLKINADKKYIWLHDVISESEFTEERLNEIDKIFVLSEFQRSLFPKIKDDKFFITRNGIAKSFPKVERDYNKLIWTSSYDRGLKTMLKLFPLIRKEIPDAELHIFYGWSVWDSVHKNDPEKQKEKQELIKMMEQDGVYEHGRVSQEQIIKEYGKASLWVYPTEFPEISCITAMKAQAMGCIPVTTTRAALNETVQFGLKVETDDIYTNEEAQNEFITGVINLLKKPPKEKDRKEMMDWARKEYDWDKVANEWDKLIK